MKEVRRVMVTRFLAFVVCQRLEEAGGFSVLWGNMVEGKTIRYSSVAQDLDGRQSEELAGLSC